MTETDDPAGAARIRKTIRHGFYGAQEKEHAEDSAAQRRGWEPRHGKAGVKSTGRSLLSTQPFGTSKR